MGDGRTRYNKMVNLLKPLVGKTMHIDLISRKIKINIGTSDTLVRDTLRFMIDTGLIHEVKHMVFKIRSAELE